MRAEKMAEFEKWKNPPKRNFVITRKESQEPGVSDWGFEWLESRVLHKEYVSHTKVKGYFQNVSLYILRNHWQISIENFLAITQAVSVWIVILA